MGDKAAARRLAASLGVPVLPGFDEPDASDEALIAAAAHVGFPLLVKPAAGGGGKGMRTVRGPEALPDAIAAARREAAAAFDDDRLILERLVVGARHVEIQVLFDGHGTGIHLGERDCSIQRRHQKILEETPSPAVDAALRDRLGEAALTLGRAVGYVSAGTCEFLLDTHGRPTFLEMNTRLQVEHPVTEMVTGRDLVADQLRIAAGGRLDVADSDAVASTGHAVEVRLYAEDAENRFLPATGRIEALRWPAGEGIRVDAGIEPGSEIGGRFDPMLAKIVAWGPDRAAAFERLARALDATVVLGVVTNLRFLRWLVRQPVVLDGQARTDVLHRIWPPDAWAEMTEIPDEAWASAAAALVADPDADRSLGGRVAAQRGALGPGRVGRRSPDRSRSPTPRRPPGPAFASVRAGDTVHLDLAGRSVPFRLAAPPDVDAAARAAASHGVAGSTGPAEVDCPDARRRPDRPCRHGPGGRGRRPDRDPRGDEDGARRGRLDRRQRRRGPGPAGRPGHPRPAARGHRTLTATVRVGSRRFDDGGSHGPTQDRDHGRSGPHGRSGAPATDARRIAGAPPRDQASPERRGARQP